MAVTVGSYYNDKELIFKSGTGWTIAGGGDGRLTVTSAGKKIAEFNAWNYVFFSESAKITLKKVEPEITKVATE